MVESAGLMYALAMTLSILAILAVILRFYARHIKQTAISWDDYAILLTLLLTIGNAICMIIGTAIGNLGQHTEFVEDGIRIFDHRLMVFQQTLFASQLTTTLIFGFTKVSVLIFYKRIFRGSVFLVSVWTMIIVTSVWTIGFFFANLLQCWPLWENWHGFGGDNCVNTNTMYLAQAWSDVLIDVIILSLPLPNIWALQMSTTHKLGISGMFLLGALSVGAGIAKLIVFNKIIQELNIGFWDISYLETPLVYWPMIESSVGIVGACLPMLRPLFNVRPQLRPQPISPLFRPLRVSCSPFPRPRSSAPALDLENLPLSPLSLRMDLSLRMETVSAAPVSAASTSPCSQAPSTLQHVNSCLPPPVLPSIAPSIPFIHEVLDTMGITRLAEPQE